jgi:hypothetical protein
MDITKQPKIRILLATPCYGNMLSTVYFNSILKMIAMYANDPDIHISVYTLGNESLITRARNICVGLFLKGNYTHLLFVDADIEFEPECIRRLLDHNQDIVCAPYAQKNVKWHLLKDDAFKKEMDHRSLDELKKMMLTFNIHWKTDCETKKPIITNNFTEVDRAATGFMLIKRTVFSKLMKACPELKYDSDDAGEDHIKNHLWLFFDCMVDGRNKYLSEDYAFCERVRTKINGKIWVDLTSNLGHMGNMIFR